MKVLAITADIDPQNLGGAESHFVEVAKRLAPKIDILSPKISYPHIPNLTGIFYILFATPVMLYQSIKFKPNLIWATLDFPQAQVGALVKLLTGRPLYVTSQNPMIGNEELVGTGGGFVKFFVSWAFRQTNIVAAVSSYSAKLAKKLGAKNITIISNGIDIDNYDVSIHHQKLDHPLKIITTSSLIPRNGIDTLIDACSLLPFKFELVIAGDGPEEKNLKNLAKDIPVKFLGRVPNNLIPSLLATSHLFVRPSRFEGFGSSFIEAMAAGLPTIGTPIGGIVDFLIDNKTGFVAPVDDPKALAEKINYIYNHPKESKKIALAGQKFVKENYSWDKIAKEVYKIWTQL